MSIPNLLKNILKALLLPLVIPYHSFADSLPLKHIAITQFVEHMAADAVREGVLQALKKRGYDPEKNLEVTFENAQGNAATAGQIARKFIGIHPDAVVAITTPSAQAMVKAAGRESFPIIFTAVTDPVEAGLVSSLEKEHNGNVTGIRDTPPIHEQIKLIKTLLPTAKIVGVLYNPGDSGSVASLEVIQKEAAQQGLTLVYGTPLKSSDIQAAVLQLVGKVDALYVPLDNMLVSAMKTVSSLALKYTIPLFSADSGSVEAGAFACLGYSYGQVGRTTGDLVADILEGKDPKTIPVASPSTTEFFVNSKALKALKLTLPEELSKKAVFVELESI
jgi:putative tryptophan/tyrosine transport system substrate-binding protein